MSWRPIESALKNYEPPIFIRRRGEVPEVARWTKCVVNGARLDGWQKADSHHWCDRDPDEWMPIPE
jgi:hypothetical protein